ncbi:unnamed protein product, partial [marine sediment metagenome]
MPLYTYRCDKCVLEIEKIQEINGETPCCPKCGAEMRKKPTFPAMVKMKGMGGYPSRRKEWKGTAPYTR